MIIYSRVIARRAGFAATLYAVSSSDIKGRCVDVLMDDQSGSHNEVINSIPSSSAMST